MYNIGGRRRVGFRKKRFSDGRDKSLIVMRSSVDVRRV